MNFTLKNFLHFMEFLTKNFDIVNIVVVVDVTSHVVNFFNFYQTQFVSTKSSFRIPFFIIQQIWFFIYKVFLKLFSKIFPVLLSSIGLHGSFWIFRSMNININSLFVKQPIRIFRYTNILLMSCTCAGDQSKLGGPKAGGPENLLALRAEGTRVSS